MIRFDTSQLKRHMEQLRKAKRMLDQQFPAALNEVTDRHLARTIENTDVGESPSSPSLRNRWDRSGVFRVARTYTAEVFNPLEYASYYEYGHRQKPGRLVFIELRPGTRRYGQIAKAYKGKYGIFVRLKAPFVKGRFPLTNSEEKAQQELDQAVKDFRKQLEVMLK